MMHIQNKHGIRFLLLSMLFLMLFSGFAVQAHAFWIQNQDGTCSYQNSGGKLARNKWIKKKYYVDANGIRVTGRYQIGSKWYYFSSENGKLLKNQWIEDENGTYYASAKGSLYANCIRAVGENKYLFGAGGIMKTGKCTYKKKTYYLDPDDGHMKKGIWVKINNRYYYFNDNGVMAKNKWLSDYTYYVGSKGYRLTSKWKNGRYLGSSGKAYTGLQEISGSYYYFDSKTHRKTTNTTIIIDGRWWSFDKEGKGTQNEVPAPGAGVSVQPEYYTQPVIDDETLLSYIIYCEAGNQPYEGKVAVGYVIMNRVYSDQFSASTLREAIYEKNQFSPVWDGSMARVFANPALVNEECKKAAKYVMKMQPRIAAGKTLKLKVNGKKTAFPYLFYMSAASYQGFCLTASCTPIGDHVFFTSWN